MQFLVKFRRHIKCVGWEDLQFYKWYLGINIRHKSLGGNRKSMVAIRSPLRASRVSIHNPVPVTKTRL